MNQNCKTCRWGPRQINCLRPRCDYELFTNAELVRRLRDDQLIELLSGFPRTSNKDFWANWIKKNADDELIRRFYAE